MRKQAGRVEAGADCAVEALETPGRHEHQLVREADHRIANDLALLAGFVRLKTRDLAGRTDGGESRDLLLLLENVRGQIESIAMQHRAMAHGEFSEPVDLGDRLHLVCAPLRAILSDRMLLVEDFTPGIVAPRALVQPLAQIVGELVTNAIKHACRTNRLGTVVVRCRANPVYGIAIEVADDGPGLAADADPLKSGGLGLRLIQALAVQIGARLTLDSTGSGLSVRLTCGPAAAA